MNTRSLSRKLPEVGTSSHVANKRKVDKNVFLKGGNDNQLHVTGLKLYLVS